MIENLLDRQTIHPETAGMMACITHRRILVTGGGGSTAAANCAVQTAGYHPKQLIIFDIYENNAYELQMELQFRYPKLDLIVLIGSVRDEKRVMTIFEKIPARNY